MWVTAEGGSSMQLQALQISGESEILKFLTAPSFPRLSPNPGGGITWNER